MSIRLVDIGIPSYVKKTKRVEVPYSADEKKTLQQRIDSGEITERKAFPKRFEIEEDTKANLELYKSIINKIPPMPGWLIIRDRFDTQNRLLAQIKTEFDMREEFIRMIKIRNIRGTEIELNSYHWLRYLTNEREIVEVCFSLGRER
jgi:hypothetical protein